MTPKSSTSAPTITSAWPTTRPIVDAAFERLENLGLWALIGSIHLRHAGHPQALRRADRPVLWQSRQHPLHFVLRCQWRTVRAAADRAGRDRLDELNHASIIDGVRLCKAQRFRYKHNDMADLRAKLEEAKCCRFKLIFTDSVFTWMAISPACRTSATWRTLQCSSWDRRLPRHRSPGTDRPRSGRGTRRSRPYRHHHGYAGENTGWSKWRVHGCSAEIVDWLRNRSRPTCSPKRSAGPGGRGDEGSGTGGYGGRTAQNSKRTRKIAGGFGGGGFYSQARADPDFAGHARRRRDRHEDGRRTAEAWDLRDRF